MRCDGCEYLRGGKCTYDPAKDHTEPRCVSEMIDRMVKAMEEDGVVL